MKRASVMANAGSNGRGSFPGDLLQYTFLALLVCLPALMNTGVDRSFEIARLMVVIPLSVLGLALLLWLRRRQPMAAGEIWPGALLLVLATVLLVSTLNSASPLAALFGNHDRREGLLLWLCNIVAFFMTLSVANQPDGKGRILDALVLSSLLPCAYALQQQVGLDFFLFKLDDPSRQSGSLGNPNYLASFIAFVLPLSVARLWLASRAARGRWIWATIVLIQSAALLQTQSRGVMLGLAMAAAFVVPLMALRTGSLRVIRISAGSLAAIALAIAAINTSGSLQGLVTDIPLANRMIFLPKGDIGRATVMSTQGDLSRLGVWHAAVETFRNAPVSRKLLGFGPDGAFPPTLAHMPASVMNSQGFEYRHTFDRAHSDLLEFLLTFGLAGTVAYGMFFSFIVFVASRTLVRPATLTARSFGLWSASGGVIGAVAAIAAGLPSAAPPALAIGLAAGWSGCLLVHGIRSAKLSPPSLTPDQALLAALLTSMVAFWIDAQLNVIGMTARLLSFATAGLILHLCSRADADSSAAHTDPKGSAEIVLWMTGIVLVAAIASFFPVFVTDTVHGPAWYAFPLRLPALLTVLAVSLALVRLHATDDGAAAARTPSPWRRAIVPGLAFSVIYFGIGTGIDSVLSASLPTQIAALYSLVALFILATCIWLVLRRHRAAHWIRLAAVVPVISAMTIATAVLVSSALYFGWRQTLAGVASPLAVAATRAGQVEIAAAYRRLAAATMPTDTHYRRLLIVADLEAGAERLSSAQGRLPALQEAAFVLERAEQAARASVREFPDQPWLIMSLANVRQLQAHPALHRFAPSVAPLAAAEARELFHQAHRLYPAQPLVFRNLAQLEFAQGDVRAAEHALDRMEKLIPTRPDAYREQIRMSAAQGNQRAIATVLSRAEANLDAMSAESLRNWVGNSAAK